MASSTHHAGAVVLVAMLQQALAGLDGLEEAGVGVTVAVGVAGIWVRRVAVGDVTTTATDSVAVGRSGLGG